jgi:hypothetical protein
MELDGDNRRYLITTSAQIAHHYRAYFIPNLLHCGDCIPAKVVGDIYLDSGGSYAFYYRAHGDTQLDLLDTCNKYSLNRMRSFQ